MFKNQISYTDITNVQCVYWSNTTIEHKAVDEPHDCYSSQQTFPKSHRQPHCTLQLVCEDRVLFVSVDIHVLFIQAAASKMTDSNSSGVSKLSFVHFALHPAPRRRKM